MKISRNFSIVFYTLSILCLSWMLNGQDYHIKGNIENSDVEILIESVDSTPVPLYEVELHPNGESFYTIKFLETIPQDGSFRVTASKTDLIPNGNSTLDLVLILRYILAFDSYDNYGELLASDTNQNGKVSVLDLIILRRWILAIANDSQWIFFDKDPRLVDINESNPDLLPNAFQELNYNSLPVENIDFFGIKLGDVNDTAVIN